jgi:hypothetical protein
MMMMVMMSSKDIKKDGADRSTIRAWRRTMNILTHPRGPIVSALRRPTTTTKHDDGCVWPDSLTAAQQIHVFDVSINP